MLIGIYYKDPRRTLIYSKFHPLFSVGRPAESYVTSLSDAEVHAIVELVRGRTGLEARAYYGSADERYDDLYSAASDTHHLVTAALEFV